ncbi:hypothetical protein D5S17_23250 [Pseudonocardiaceae bacterium YIM PH 21723]|nr:hypothetical protein D5S17_23250 [Pseudonocardiaceae bacterium YIM PH 21723]
MNPYLMAVLTPAAVVLVVGAAITWDRLREPHRPLHRPVVVVDERTYRDACRRVDKLIAVESWSAVYTATTAICVWLKSERHFGSRRRQARLTAALEQWTARKQEYSLAARV